jgi:hypothetical protein
MCLGLTMGLFYGGARFGRGKGSIAQIDYTIRTKQIYVSALINIMAVLAVVTLAMSLVPGMGLGGGAAGVTFSAMPHIIWMLPTFAILYFVAQAIYFDSNADYTNTASWLMVGCVFMLVEAAVNLVHMVALILEVGNVDSTFWLQTTGAWVYVLVTEMALFLLWSVWISWRLYVLRHDIIIGFQLGWRPGIAISEDELNAPLLTERDDDEQDVQNVVVDLKTPQAPDASVPPPPTAPSDAAGAKVFSVIAHAIGVRVGDTSSYKKSK